MQLDPDENKRITKKRCSLKTTSNVPTYNSTVALRLGIKANESIGTVGLGIEKGNRRTLLHLN